MNPTEIRAQRRLRRLTQEELGRALGVTGSAVGQWESGRTTPSWIQGQRLEKFFAGGDLPPDAATVMTTRIEVLEQELRDLRREIAQANYGRALNERPADGPEPASPSSRSNAPDPPAGGDEDAR